MSSVPLGDRKESRLEVINYSIKLHNMLREFMQRNFGVRDLEQFVRVQYARGKDKTENFARYRYWMETHKKTIDLLCTLLTNNIIAANRIHPIIMAEYETRRSYQNAAIVNCEQINKELQRVADTFEVDVNTYRRYIEAIDWEIHLITRWRQKDNKIKSYLQKGSF